MRVLMPCRANLTLKQPKAERKRNNKDNYFSSTRKCAWILWLELGRFKSDKSTIKALYKCKADAGYL